MLEPKEAWDFLSPIVGSTTSWGEGEDGHADGVPVRVAWIYIRKPFYKIIQVRNWVENETIGYDYAFDSNIEEIEYDGGLYSIALRFSTWSEFSNFLIDKNLRSFLYAYHDFDREAFYGDEFKRFRGQSLTPKMLEACHRFIKDFKLQPYYKF